MSTGRIHPDFELIQGAWKTLFAWTNGERYETALHRDVIEVFGDGGFWWDYPAKNLQSNLFEYHLDPTTSPKSIDLISEEGVMHGIYRLTRQTLTTCYPEEDGMDRPTEFISCATRCWALAIRKRLPTCPLECSPA